MKEYCTYVTTRIDSTFGLPLFSTKTADELKYNGVGLSVLEALMHDGWECIDASTLPKLSLMGDESPRFAFILEREVRDENVEKAKIEEYRRNIHDGVRCSAYERNLRCLLSEGHVEAGRPAHYFEEDRDERIP